MVTSILMNNLDTQKSTYPLIILKV